MNFRDWLGKFGLEPGAEWLTRHAEGTPPPFSGAYSPSFSRDVHLPALTRYLSKRWPGMEKQLLKEARAVERRLTKGLGNFMTEIPTGTGLNALNLAPIPSQLIQRMLQQYHPET